VTSLKNLAYYRKISGLKQSEIADALGIDQGFISRLERCKKDCSLSLALEISEFLNIDLFRLTQEDRGENDEAG
jgi:transcriptional regulator with XRE-family HTH domain